jgi:hypothetical protein
LKYTKGDHHSQQFEKNNTIYCSFLLHSMQQCIIVLIH